MQKSFYIIAAVAISVLFSVAAQAEIYRWTDKNGKVHFSDKPVGDKVEKLDIKVKKDSAASIQIRKERKQRADNFLRARKEEREIIENKIKEKKRLKVERKKNCKKARKEYKRITEAGALYFKNKDGSRDYLETGRREKEEALAKAAIKKWCK